MPFPILCVLSSPRAVAQQKLCQHPLVVGHPRIFETFGNVGARGPAFERWIKRAPAVKVGWTLYCAVVGAKWADTSRYGNHNILVKNDNRVKFHETQVDFHGR